MVKKLLSEAEIGDLITILSNFYNFHDEQCKFNSLSESIQYPQTPSTLSESIAHLLISKKRLITELCDFECRLGSKNEPDLVATRGRSEKWIEVKGSGKTEFQEVKKKDLKADYLIWVCFGDRFHTGQKQNILIYVLKNPSAVIKRPRKLSLSEFKDIGGKKVQEIGIYL